MSKDLRIILLESVDGLGHAGSEHSVSPAYAQRVLLPRKLAVTATPRERARVTAHTHRAKQTEDRRLEQAAGVVKALSGRTLLLRAKASGAKLYGSISAVEIAEAARTNLGAALDPSWVQLDRSITTVGDHRIRITPPGAQPANLTVTVTAA